MLFWVFLGVALVVQRLDRRRPTGPATKADVIVCTFLVCAIVVR